MDCAKVWYHAGSDAQSKQLRRGAAATRIKPEPQNPNSKIAEP